MGQGFLIVESSRSYWNILKSVRLLRTSNQTVAGTSAWQQTTFARDRPPYSQANSKPKSKKASNLSPRLRLTRPLGSDFLQSVSWANGIVSTRLHRSMWVFSVPSRLKNSVIKIKIQGISKNSCYGILELTPCNLIIGYYNFGRICCFRLQDQIKEGTTVENYRSTIHWRTAGSDAPATISQNKAQPLFQTSAIFWMLYAFFWVISRCLNFMCWRFGTLCLFHLHRQVGKFRAVPDGPSRSYLQTCMTYTIAECTIIKSWRRTEELSETCRVPCQDKFAKLVHLVGFTIKIKVTFTSKWSLWCFYLFMWVITQVDVWYNWLPILNPFITCHIMALINPANTKYSLGIYICGNKHIHFLFCHTIDAWNLLK